MESRGRGLPARVRSRRWARIASTAAFVLGSMIGFSLFPPTERAWVAESRAVVEPAPGAPSWLRAYKYDLLTREFVVPTMREIVAARTLSAAPTSGVFGVQGGDVDALVEASDSAVITVSVTAQDAATAEEAAHRILHEGASYVNSLDGLFVLEPFDTSNARARPFEVVSTLTVVATLAVCFSLAWLVFLAWPGREHAHEESSP